MTKDARLSIRVTSELDSWLDSEAASRGLDKAAFARMVLFERMNGRVAAPSKAEPVPYSTYSEVEAALERLPDGYVPFEQPDTAAAASAEDIEAIIERRVADALAAIPTVAYDEVTPEIRVIRPGHLPEYGGAANGGVPFRIQRLPGYGPG